ncbi:MAG: glycosyltransferase family 39 protein [Acidobacteria bacterium]|nr:glycosyltransferase family 39 protein [Acidobacteriota bacterium]
MKIGSRTVNVVANGVAPTFEISARDTAYLLLLALSALAVRVPNSGGDLWLDEIATVKDFVRLPFLQIVSTYTANNHILYSILARICVLLLGETGFAVRLPALVFGAALPPALYYLGRTITSRHEALSAALIAAVSYHLVYFSQNARGYTAYLFFSTLSTAYLLRALSTDRRRYWAIFAVLTVLNLYAHLDGVFVLAGQVLAVISFITVTREKRVGVVLKHLSVAVLCSAVTVGVLYAPAARSLFQYAETANYRVGWPPLSWELVQAIFRQGLPGMASVALAIPMLPVVAAGLVSMVHSAPLFLSILCLTLLGRVGAVLALGSGTYPRAFIIVLPFGILIAVRGLFTLAGYLSRWLKPDRARDSFSRYVAAFLIFIAAAGAASGLPRLYRLPKQDYTGALAFVRQHRSPRDVVAAAYITDTGCRFYDPTVLSARTAPQLQQILDRGAPVWLLGTFLDQMRTREPRLASMVESHFQTIRRFPGIVGDGTVVVWKSKDVR